jgi:hypothetical protein
MISRLYLSILLLVVGTAVASAQQWIEHQPPGSGYRVEFPAPPSLTTESVDTKFGKIVTTIAEYHGTSDVMLRAAYSQYPKTIPGDPETFLDASTNGGVRRSGSKLREEKRVRVNGLPGRLAVFDQPEDNVVSVCLLVLGSDRLYLLQAVVPRNQEDSPIVQRFLNSFALLPR